MSTLVYFSHHKHTSNFYAFLWLALQNQCVWYCSAITLVTFWLAAASGVHKQSIGPPADISTVRFQELPLMAALISLISFDSHIATTLMTPPKHSNYMVWEQKQRLKTLTDLTLFFLVDLRTLRYVAPSPVVGLPCFAKPPFKLLSVSDFPNMQDCKNGIEFGRTWKKQLKERSLTNLAFEPSEGSSWELRL